MKLTDTQLVILSKASQRDDRAVELPATLKGGAARKVVDRLLQAGLLNEVQARSGLPAWRRDDEGRPFALRLTRQGLKAIEVDDGEPDASSTEPPAPEAGLGSGPARARSQPAGRKRQSKGRDRNDAAGGKRADSKQATVLALLRRREGATVPAMVQATGWQPHSVRGFLAGVVRKKLSLTLVSDKSGNERVYRIVEA